jgi:hypothetical protein
MRSFWLSVLGLAVAAGMIGCGGGGGQPARSIALATPSVTIDWAARTRGVQGPSSALSATIVLKAATSTEQDLAFSVDRISSPLAYTQTYSAPSTISTGRHTLQISFTANSSGQGGVVGTASAPVLVSASGQLTNLDGSALGFVETDSRLSTVTVAPDQIAIVGQPYAVLLSVRDVSGNLIAVTPGSIVWRALDSNGFATVTSDGMLVASIFGIVNITATVDGIQSNTQQISALVGSAPTIRTTTQATNQMVLSPTTGRLWASVPGVAPANANAVVEIDPSSGAVVGSVQAGSEPTPIDISTDGSTIYVGLSGADSIARIDTASHTLLATYPVPGDTTLNMPYLATDLKVAPGSVTEIAITRGGSETSSIYGPMILDSGMPRTQHLGIYEGTQLAFNPAGGLFTLENDSSADLRQCAISASGVVTAATTSNVIRDSGATLQVVGGRLYASDGTVLDASTIQPVGQAPVAAGKACAVDLANGLIFYLDQSQNSPSAHLVTAKLSTLKLLSSIPVPGTLDARAGLTRVGAKGLAYRTANTLYFVDNAPGL